MVEFLPDPKRQTEITHSGHSIDPLGKDVCEEILLLQLLYELVVPKVGVAPVGYERRVLEGLVVGVVRSSHLELMVVQQIRGGVYFGEGGCEVLPNHPHELHLTRRSRNRFIGVDNSGNFEIVSGGSRDERYLCGEPPPQPVSQHHHN